MLQTQRDTQRDQNNTTHKKTLLYKNTIPEFFLSSKSKTPALEEEEEE
jgi:hypothetical protein